MLFCESEATCTATLSVLHTKIVEWFVAPIFDWRGWDRTWLRYVSGLTGLLLGLAARLDLLAEAGIVLDYRLGVLLTALLIGGGAGLIYDIFTDRGEPRLPPRDRPRLPPWDEPRLPAGEG